MDPECQKNLTNLKIQDRCSISQKVLCKCSHTDAQQKVKRYNLNRVRHVGFAHEHAN